MIWIVLLGVATGMRTMTPITVLCWFAWLGLLPQHGWAFWTGYLVSAIVFTVFALGEYFGDTLPTTPSRTKPALVFGRLVFGSLVGALAANALHDPWAGGVILGAIGALIGTFGFHKLRMVGAKAAGRDLPIAIMESTLALCFALLAAWVLHSDFVRESAKSML
jgi:uncharacterized membrane protein